MLQKCKWSLTARFLYARGDYSSLKNDLKEVNWTEIKDLDVTKEWDSFANKVEETMEKNIPKSKPCRTKVDTKKKKPFWMCKEALTKVKKKYHAWKRYTATKHYKDYETYIKLRNEATEVVWSAKRQFERKLAKETKTGPKQRWRVKSVILWKKMVIRHPVMKRRLRF